MDEHSSHSFAADYWRSAPKPLESLAFITPLLLAYEGSLLVLGSQATLNGADYWLRQLLEAIGFSQYFLLPLLTISWLLAAHHLSHAPWHCSWKTVAVMGLEAGIAAVGLRLLAEVGSYFSSEIVLQTGGQRPVGQLCSYLGAGIYEEFVFRLLLIPVLAAILQACGWRDVSRWTAAIFLSSLCFAAAHYEWQLPWGDGWRFPGETFQVPSFLFRTGAGLFFGVLFLKRGFGIVAGTHAFYDLLVGW